MIAGSATSEGTAANRANHPELTYNLLDETGLWVSQAGFGGYRVHQSDPAHGQALHKALLSGINLIDTSANYTNGGSEILVGRVLKDLIDAEKLRRESVVVVTKAGYLQGENYLLSQERKELGRPFPDLVLFGHGLEHCIHPEFLEDQLLRSLGRLGLLTVDLFLLHNPEYYLNWASQSGLPQAEAEKEYYRRIALAFEFLESQVKKERIRWYGISSNTLPQPADNCEFTSLEKIWALAERISSNHHFRVIQLPFNFLETGAVTEINQSGGRSVLDLAQEKGLAVLTNRPLNAVSGQKLIRLAEAEPVVPPARPEILNKISQVIRSETKLFEELLPSLNLPDQLKAMTAENLALGRIVQENWDKVGTLSRWQAWEQDFFRPRINEACQFLATLEEVPEELTAWLRLHMDLIQAAFSAIERNYRAGRAERSLKIKRLLNSVDQEWASAGTLTRMALRALRTTAGVTTVLVGMRRAEYVDDVLAELIVPLVRKERTATWRNLSRLLKNLD